MIFTKTTRLNLLIVFFVLMFNNKAFSQFNYSNWGLTQTAYKGFYYNSGTNLIAVKAKYSSKNFKSVLYNEVLNYGYAKMSINGLDPSDYSKFYGYTYMSLGRDTSNVLGFMQYPSMRLNGSSSNYGKDFETDADDNYILLADNVGNGWDLQNPVVSSNKDSTQILLCKVTPTGSILWQKMYGGSSAEYAIAIKKTLDGNFMVLAQTQSNDGNVVGYNGGKDIWLLKINSNDGSIMWQKTIGTAVDEIPTSMQVLQDGSIVIAGAAQNSILFPSIYAGLNSFLLKLDDKGNIQWAKTFGGNGSDKITAFVPIPNGDFVSLGTSTSSDGDYPINKGGSDVYIFRHSSNGTILWKKHYGLVDNDLAGDIAFTPCDSVIYVSWAKQYGGPILPYYVIPAYAQSFGISVKLKSDGTQFYYYEDNTKYPYGNAEDFPFDENLTTSIVTNNIGGILVLNASYWKWGLSIAVGAGTVTRSFVVYEYGIKLSIKNTDTTICKGQNVWGRSFYNDTTFSDTLRTACGIDTLINNYLVRIISADTSIIKDTTICYGSTFKGIPVYASFSKKDSIMINTACGLKYTITTSNVKVIATVDSSVIKDTVICYGSTFNGISIYTPFIAKDTTMINTVCGARYLITTKNVKVAPPIPRSFSGDTLLCADQNFKLVAYSPALSYHWQDGSTKNYYTLKTAGLYWLETVDTFGCKYHDSIVVRQSDLYLSLFKDTTINLNDFITLFPITNGKVVWTFDPTLSCITCTNPVATPLTSTIYSLHSSKDQCILNTSITVRVNKEYYLYIPNAFTPNNDNLNNNFKVITNLTGLFVLEIYNRYGSKVYSSTSSTQGWDGTINGISQPIGSYYYVLTFKNQNEAIETKKGSIMLIR